jgi:hypothetical protein
MTNLDLGEERQRVGVDHDLPVVVVLGLGAHFLDCPAARATSVSHHMNLIVDT